MSVQEYILYTEEFLMKNVHWVDEMHAYIGIINFNADECHLKQLKLNKCLRPGDHQGATSMSVG